MSDATFTIEQRRVLAEIDQAQANTRKLLSEATKLATARKLAGWQIAITGVAAGAGIVGALVAVFKVLRV